MGHDLRMNYVDHQLLFPLAVNIYTYDIYIYVRKKPSSGLIVR